MWSLNEGGVGRTRPLSINRHVTRYNLKMVQDRRIVLLKLNRKLYALYQMVMLPMTLGDP